MYVGTQDLKRIVLDLRERVLQAEEQRVAAGAAAGAQGPAQAPPLPAPADVPQPTQPAEPGALPSGTAQVRVVRGGAGR